MERLINRLQLKDYRLVLAIRQTGQLALAAEQLSITQPAASRMLASIERSVGSKLFDRHPKGMRPTPIGEILARNAVNLLRGLDMTEREMRSFGAGITGTARVGAVTGGAVGFIVPAITALKRQTGGAEIADIYVDVAPSDVLIEGLTKGEYDFVLSRLPPGADARLFRIEPGHVEVISFLTRGGHPLMPCATRPLGDLEGYEWVIQSPHTPMRRAVEAAFIAKGIPVPAEIVNTTSLLVMIAYLDSTDAIAPVPREVAELLTSDGKNNALAALHIDDPIVISPYHVIAFKDRTISPMAEKLLDLVLARLAG